MNSSLRIVYLEDDAADVRLVQDTFNDDGLFPELIAVDNRDEFFAALKQCPNLILADYSLPTFDGLEALALCRGLCPEVPFIFLTGAIGEERAIETIKAGATDYVLKTRLSRLCMAVRRAISQAEDVARRKRAEEELRVSQERLALAASGTRTGMFDWNLTTGETLWTEQHSRLWGLSSTSAGPASTTLSQPYHYRDWAARVHPDDLAGVEKEFERCIAQREPLEIEYRIVWPDDSVHWIASRGAVYFDTQNQPQRILGIVMDITDRKQGEEQLNAATAAAEVANLAKSQFLANISHELRTPMNAILGMIDIALPTARNLMVRDCLQTAKESAGLLLKLLNDLLDSAKIESGKLELESAPFGLRRMLDHVTRVLSARASEKGLCFNCRISEATPDAVLGDRMRLQQVLLNLAGNAIKFTEHGEVEISLRTPETSEMESEYDPKPGEEDGTAERNSDRVADGVSHLPEVEPQSLPSSVVLEFAVRDTGIGIAAADLEYVFRPFAQGDASMARRFGGTGLGLSICKSLVERMGGRIWAKSEQGKGSEFYFQIELPLAAELPADARPRANFPKSACSPLRILLVEDNIANQKLANYVLQDRGHLVDIAGDGKEAIRFTEQSRYDVILMDVQMPEMNGLDATAEIRSRESGRRVPIIAMTAHAMQSDRDRCMAAGMDDYLCKPVQREELIETVERLAQLGLEPMNEGDGLADEPDWKADEGFEEDNHDDDPSPLAGNSLGFEPQTALPPANSPLFNLDEALARLGGNFSLFQEMAGFLFSDGLNLLPEIRAAAAAGQATVVEQKAHRLKGTLLYLGAKPATESVDRIEALGRSRNLGNAAGAIRSMEEEINRLAAALRPYTPGACSIGEDAPCAPKE